MPPRNGPKVRCVLCGHLYSRVLPQAKTYGHGLERGEDVYRRVRQCLRCETVYTAVEQAEAIVIAGRIPI